MRSGGIAQKMGMTRVFTDAERTRQAVDELTRGLTRSSRMMQQLLPLGLDWLSTSPDPSTCSWPGGHVTWAVPLSSCCPAACRHSSLAP